jgi:hypothetical protein
MTTKTAPPAISNARRKFRASRGDGVALPKKGNVNSTYAGQINARDTKPAFPQIIFGQMKAYSVDPYEIVNGVYFDVPRGVSGGPGSRVAPKSPAKSPAKRRRTDPGPGTRTSLRSIRSKG